MESLDALVTAVVIITEEYLEKILQTLKQDKNTCIKQFVEGGVGRKISSVFYIDEADSGDLDTQVSSIYITPKLYPHF